MDGLDVSSVVGAGRQSRYGTRLREPWRPQPPRRGLGWPFLLFVILPTMLAAGYLYAVAADQYVSEARFVVRGRTPPAPAGLSSLLQTAGVSSPGQDDSFAVQDYILSRDALHELVDAEDVKAVFGRSEADPLSRFPVLAHWDTFEHLFRYYLKHVAVHMDSATGVSELTVRTFRADDSRRIAAALLAAGERLVNRMNDRQRENAVRDARKEVDLAEARVQDVARRLADFRNSAALLDPGKQSVSMLDAIAKLQTRLVSLNLEISQMQGNSPLLPAARQRAVALQAQIDDGKRQITGFGTSLVPKIREFDQLAMEREFADKLLGSAMSSLESARVTASRQLLYLEPVVAPNEPDYAEYPRRISDLALVFAIMVCAYGAGKMAFGAMREHKLV